MAFYKSIHVCSMLLLLIDFFYCKLVCVIDVNRHGDRTPKPFPIFTSKLFYKSLLSALTINGYRQNQLLGRWFYERYIEEQQFISEVYNGEEVLFMSSPIVRTIFSGTGFVQGLFPRYIIRPMFNKDKSNFRNNLEPPIKNFKLVENNYLEIPLYIENTLNDNIIHPIKCKLNSNSTKGIKEELFVHNKLFAQPEGNLLKEVIDDIKRNIPYLFQELTDAEVYNSSFFSDLVKFVVVMEDKLIQKYKLTEKTRKILREQSLDRWYSFRHTDSEGEKLVSSGLFDFFVDKFDSKINNEKAHKMIIVSAHDTTIMQILSNLLDRDYLKQIILGASDDQELFEFLGPKFSSSFILELHYEQEKYFIRIIYNGQEITENLVKQLKYDKSLHGYTYDSFKDYTKERIDRRYNSLFCNTDNEIDYTIVGTSESEQLSNVTQTDSSEQEIYENVKRYICDK